jgi:hypothetical protein
MTATIPPGSESLRPHRRWVRPLGVALVVATWGYGLYRYAFARPIRIPADLRVAYETDDSCAPGEPSSGGVSIVIESSGSVDVEHSRMYRRQRQRRTAAPDQIDRLVGELRDADVDSLADSYHVVEGCEKLTFTAEFRTKTIRLGYASPTPPPEQLARLRNTILRIAKGEVAR